MGLVQRRGVKDRVHALHAAYHIGTVNDGADVTRERGRRDVEADDFITRIRVRTSASPRWPALPVINSLMFSQVALKVDSRRRKARLIGRYLNCSEERTWFRQLTKTP